MGSTKWAGLAAVSMFLTCSVVGQASAKCLSWNGAQTITGKLAIESYPGRPNYESIADGDEEERVPVVTLDQPVCVDEDPSDAEGMSPKLTDVRKVQIAMPADAFRDKLGSKVVAVGAIWVGHTGHHHTPFLMSDARVVSADAQASDRITQTFGAWTVSTDETGAWTGTAQFASHPTVRSLKFYCTGPKSLGVKLATARPSSGPGELWISTGPDTSGIAYDRNGVLDIQAVSEFVKEFAEAEKDGEAHRAQYSDDEIDDTVGIGIGAWDDTSPVRLVGMTAMRSRLRDLCGQTQAASNGQVTSASIVAPEPNEAALQGARRTFLNECRIKFGNPLCACMLNEYGKNARTISADKNARGMIDNVQNLEPLILDIQAEVLKEQNNGKSGINYDKHISYLMDRYGMQRTEKFALNAILLMEDKSRKICNK